MGIFCFVCSINNGAFIISVEELGEHTKVQIVDLNGRTRLQTSEVPENGRIEIKDFEKGIYFIILSQNGETNTQKIFIY